MTMRKPSRQLATVLLFGLSLTLWPRGGGADSTVDQPNSTTSDPVETALEWLGAARAKDAGKLMSLSRTPFVESRLRVDGCALKGRARTTKDMAKLASCIVRESLFVESIPDTTVKKYFVNWKVVALSDVEKSLRKLVAPLAKNHDLVSGDLTGSGVTYVIVLAVRRDGGVDAAVADVDVFE